MAEGGVVRIASGQGFWGDDPEAPVRQVEGGRIDYLMMDYLAEVTMSIMQKQRARDPSAGYAQDFVPLMGRIFPACIERGVTVVTNAGGVNPLGCAEALVEAGREYGVGGRATVAIVVGDDLMDRLDTLLGEGHDFRNMETDEPLAVCARSGAERQRLHGCAAHCRGSRARCRRGRDRPLDRYGANVRADDP